MTAQEIFTRPFPWNQKDFQDLVSIFKSGDAPFKTDALGVRWHWEPFHAAGFRALKYAAQKKIAPVQFEQLLEHLSCPQTPKHLEKKLKSLGVSDGEGRAQPLNPEKFIRTTYLAAQRRVDVFENSFCPKIADLRGEIGQAFRPEIIGTPEITELSSWLTNIPKVLNRFHGLDEWDKLELVEVMIGVHKSSSSLHFSRIVRK